MSSIVLQTNTCPVVTLENLLFLQTNMWFQLVEEDSEKTDSCGTSYFLFTHIRIVCQCDQ